MKKYFDGRVVIMIIKGITKTKETYDPTRTILYLLIKKSPKKSSKKYSKGDPNY